MVTVNVVYDTITFLFSMMLLVPKVYAHHDGMAGGTQPPPPAPPVAVAATGSTDIPPIMIIVGICLAVCLCGYFCSKNKNNL